MIALLILGLLWLVGFPAFVTWSSSKARSIPNTDEYEYLGFRGSNGVRFKGGVATAPGDVTKNVSYPYGELLFDDKLLVLRNRRLVNVPSSEVVLHKKDVTRVFSSRNAIAMPVVRFATQDDPTGRRKYYGGSGVVAARRARGWHVG